MAVVVTDLSDTMLREIIFTVQEDSDSPFQGRLAVDPATYQAMTALQRRALKVAQFNAWKLVRDAPRVPLTKLQLLVRLSQMRDDRLRAQSEEDQLAAEVATMPDGT